jgi:ERCC4-type nuclease
MSLSSVILAVDFRESSLMKMLTDLKVPFVSESLPLGDVLFRDLSGTAIALFERKTLDDYAGSHLTNRYREQRARLLTARAQGTQIGYLLEGGWRYGEQERVFGQPTEGKRSTVNETMLRTLAYRLQFKYKIPVIQTANVLETAYTLKHLYEIFQQDATYFKETPEEDLALAKQATATTGNFSARRKDNVEPAAAMLMGLHGVSLVKAEAILAVVPRILDLCGKSAKEIADIPAGKGRIGPKLGGDIHGALH